MESVQALSAGLCDHEDGALEAGGRELGLQRNQGASFVGEAQAQVFGRVKLTSRTPVVVYAKRESSIIHERGEVHKRHGALIKCKIGMQRSAERARRWNLRGT